MALKKIKELFRHDSTYLILFLILLASITLYKILLIYHFGPRWWSDSYDYFHYGEEILNFNFISPEAKRTPGYPIFISLALLIFGKGINGIAYLQVIFGIASIFLFYKIQIDLGLSRKLVYLNLVIFLLGPLSYFELNILSEAFTVFLTLLFFRYTQLYVLFNKRFDGIFSILFALALILTRPQFVFPLLFVAIFFFIKNYKKYAYWIAASVLLLTLLYSGINQKYNGYFGFSSYLGYNLINHTGEFIEEGKELNPGLVNIYLGTREVFKKQNAGSQAFTIWVCYKEINEKLNYNFIKLSKELTRISIILILKEPIKYLKSYSSAMYKTFSYSNEYRANVYRIYLPSFIDLIIFVSGVLLLLIIRSGNVFINFIKIVFFFNLLASGFIDKGENFRHIITLHFILILAFTSGVFLIIKKLRFEEVLPNSK